MADKNVDAATTSLRGRFHSQCGQGITLSEDRRTAGARKHSSIYGAFSREPIPNGLQFSVTILQPVEVFRLGVTTRSPDSGPLPHNLGDIISWYVVVANGHCTAWHNREQTVKPWDLDYSAGNTFGCCVSDKGELHLYHNGRDVGVALEEVPIYEQLWAFVGIAGGEVEAHDYITEETPSSPCPIGPVATSPEPREVEASSTGHPQDYAGKTFHFVERPPEWLICAVCQALAHDPEQANCCGKIYCTQCIEKWKIRSISCPTCRSTQQSDPPFSVFRDRNTRQRIGSLTVYCPNSTGGCSKTMDLSEVVKHLMSNNGCPHQVVECGNHCGHKEKRATVKKHTTNECRLRSEKCKYCPLVSTHEEVTGAHLEECPNYPLHCPNKCGVWGVTRSTLPAHREVCPLQQVECEYKRFSCTVVLPRKDIAEHLKASVETHLQMTKGIVEEQEVRLQEQQVRLQEQQVRLQEQQVRLQEQQVRLQEQQVRLQEQQVCLQEDKAERQLMKTRLQEVEATLARLMASMN